MGIAGSAAESAPKQLELLRELIPNAALFGVLVAFPLPHPSSQRPRSLGAQGSLAGASRKHGVADKHGAESNQHQNAENPTHLDRSTEADILQLFY